MDNSNTVLDFSNIVTILIWIWRKISYEVLKEDKKLCFRRKRWLRMYIVQEEKMKKHNKIISWLLMFFFLLFYCLSQAKLYIPSTLNIALILWHTKFCQNNNLITHILFELQPIMILSPVANFGHHPLHWTVCVLAYLNFRLEF